MARVLKEDTQKVNTVEIVELIVKIPAHIMATKILKVRMKLLWHRILWTAVNLIIRMSNLRHCYTATKSTSGRFLTLKQIYIGLCNRLEGTALSFLYSFYSWMHQYRGIFK